MVYNHVEKEIKFREQNDLDQKSCFMLSNF